MNQLEQQQKDERETICAAFYAEQARRRAAHEARQSREQTAASAPCALGNINIRIFLARWRPPYTKTIEFVLGPLSEE